MSQVIQKNLNHLEASENSEVDKKKHDSKKQESALVYAYVCFIESINASSLEGNSLLKQQQAGAQDASKLQSLMQQFNQKLLTQTNAGNFYTWTLIVYTNQYNTKYEFHHLTQNPAKGHNRYAGHDGNKTFAFTDNVHGTILTRHSNPRPLSPTQIARLDEQNENMSQNRDYFQGQLTKVQQGNMLVGDNVSALASSVSQETNEGMTCIHLMEKIGVSIAKSISNKRS